MAKSKQQKLGGSEGERHENHSISCLPVMTHAKYKKARQKSNV